MTAALDELDKDGDSGVENPGAKDNILVLAIVDDIDENYHNMRQILELLGFPLRVSVTGQHPTRRTRMASWFQLTRVDGFLVHLEP